jgi:hypothetical protein
MPKAREIVAPERLQRRPAGLPAKTAFALA